MQGVALVALVALALLVASRASAAPKVRQLEPGKRYRFSAVVRPPFPDEGSAAAVAFLGGLTQAVDFRELELEHVDNFPGESRLVFVAGIGHAVDLELPATIFKSGSFELTVVKVEGVS